MLINCNGKYGPELHLGVQTNKDNVENQSIWLAKEWAPKNCKSLTISGLYHTDYHGNPSAIETGYARFTVHYFTTKKEGKILLFR